MDPLVQLVDLLRPRTLLWKRIEAAGPWALAFAGSSAELIFGTVLLGECLLLRPAVRPLRLNPGDFILLHGSARFTLASGSGLAAEDAEKAFAASPDKHLRLGEAGDGSAVALSGGQFVCDALQADLLANQIPALVHLRDTAAGSARVRTLLTLSADEARAERPGGAWVVSRLMEVILVEALRQAPALRGAGCCGLLAGLADPALATALRALHGRLDHPWTVAELARRAGLSRSVFAWRFRATVGQAPLDYLLGWRMAVAKDLLARGTDALAEIAGRVGYQSASAFSTAFQRRVGCAPGRYAARTAEVAHPTKTRTKLRANASIQSQ